MTGHPLTDRQTQVVYLIAAGYTIQEIADELKVSHSAVRKLEETIRGKLGTGNRRRIPAAYADLTGFDPWPARPGSDQRR